MSQQRTKNFVSIYSYSMTTASFWFKAVYALSVISDPSVKKKGRHDIMNADCISTAFQF